MNNIISQEEKNRIDALCKQYNITKYSINPDGSIDVNGDVSLNGLGIKTLPLRFGKVTGSFDCYENQLTTLEGCPKVIVCDFDCCENYITTLMYFPKEIGGDFLSAQNSLPRGFWKSLYKSGDGIVDDEEMVTVLKYMNDYDVWTPEFNEENMNDLILDIQDGLK